MSNYAKHTITFNIADPDESSMLKHAKQRTNFSAYVKRLIYKDMSGNMRVVPEQTIEQVMEPEKEMARGFV
jgi:hypothetical protein